MRHAVFLILGLPMACSVFPERDARPVRHFAIDVGEFPKVEGPYSARLHVRPFSAPETYSYSIVSRPDPYQVDFLEDRRWVEPPADLSTAAVEQILASAGLFRPADDSPAWTLEGRVLRFDLVRDGEQVSAFASLRLEIFDGSGARIWGGTFEGRAPLQNNPGRAMSAALRELGKQIVGSLMRAELR